MENTQINSKPPSSALTQISDLTAQVHKHIQKIGGYWPPIYAVARLSEELGELAAELNSPEKDIEAITSELADIFIISTCLANQYCVHFGKAYKELSMPTALNALAQGTWIKQQKSDFLSIAIQAGRISRTINAYEGPKKPKVGETLARIQECVPALHKTLFIFSHQLGTDLVAKIKQQLAHSLKRGDAKRFQKRYDPTMTKSLDPFLNIQGQTECIFALQAKTWGAPEWNESVSLEDNMAQIMPHFLRFLKIARLEKLDGFVITAPPKYGTSIEALAETTRRVLHYISEHDPAQAHILKQDIEHPEWVFTVAQERLFIITFAPCYASTSSRYAFGEGETIISFQPHHSFENLNIPRGEQQATRDRIRQKFAQAGRPYDRPDIMNNPAEAYRYVKPLTQTDPIVKWWIADGHSHIPDDPTPKKL